MRRLRFVLISALWIGAVTWYWDTSVPLAPTRSVPAPSGQRFYGISPANEVIVGPHRVTITNPPRYLGCGPLEFWKFPEGIKTRTLFTADDEIVSGPTGKTRDFLLRRGGGLCIFDSETERPIASLPDIPDAYHCHVIGNYERVLITGKRDIHLCDIRSESLIWTASELYFDRGGGIGIGDDFFIAGRRVSGRSGYKPNSMAISLATGDADPRFDHLGKAIDIKLSADHRLALVRTPTAVSICDATTGHTLWTAPENAARANFRFSNDGSEVHIVQFTQGLGANHSRRRAFDGQPLPVPTRAELLRSTGQVTHDGRYALLHVSRSYGEQISHLINHFNQFCARWKLRAYFHTNTPEIRLTETETVRVLGFFRGSPTTLFLRDGVGIVSIADGQIEFYTLPPNRNWMWLSLWSLVPLAVLLLVPRLCRRVRARRLLSGDRD